MKKFTVLLSVLIAFASTLTLTACGKHEHNAVEGWESNSEYHWHLCESEDCTEQLDKESHNFNNGKCTECEYDVFDGDYKEITLETATEFATGLGQEGKEFKWEEGYLITVSQDVTYDVLPEDERRMTPDANIKIITSKDDNGLIVAHLNEVYTKTGLNKVDLKEVESYYQKGKLYQKETNNLSQATQIVVEMPFEDAILRSAGIATDRQWNIVLNLQLLGGGYYSDVKYYKAEDSVYTKIKIEVPTQEKDGARNSVIGCFLFDKENKLVSHYMEHNFDYFTQGVLSKSIIKVAKSSDTVPTVSNPEEYACQHNFDAGICLVCKYNVFDNLSQLQFSEVSDSDFESFVESVKGNSTQGAVDFSKYGAKMYHVSQANIDSVKHKIEDDVKVKLVDGVYNAEIITKVEPVSASAGDVTYDFTHNSYIIDKIIYSTQPNQLNNLAEITDCANDGYNSVADIIGKASAFVVGGTSHGWGVEAANLPMAYEELYKLLNSQYYYCDLNNYHVIKVVVDDQYMGQIEAIYVYDEEYDLVGFIGKNKIGDLDTIVSFSPLIEELAIPETVVNKVNDYLAQNQQ